MTKTVIGLHRMMDEAKAAYLELEQAGVKDLAYFSKDTHNHDDFVAEMRQAQVPHSISEIYERGLHAGEVVLIAHVEEQDAAAAQTIIERHTVERSSDLFPLPLAPES